MNLNVCSVWHTIKFKVSRIADAHTINSAKDRWHRCLQFAWLNTLTIHDWTSYSSDVETDLQCSRPLFNSIDGVHQWLRNEFDLSSEHIAGSSGSCQSLPSTKGSHRYLLKYVVLECLQPVIGSIMAWGRKSNGKTFGGMCEPGHPSRQHFQMKPTRSTSTSASNLSEDVQKRLPNLLGESRNP
jgi:hypothetical protein